MAIAAPVGPIGLLCIRRTLIDGWRVGLATGLGAATADAIYGGIAALGLTALIGWLTAGEDLIRLIGGLALVLIGWRTWRSSVQTVDGQPMGTAIRDAYASTVALTLANPATIVSFVGIIASLGLDDAAAPDIATVVVGVAAGSTAWWLFLTTVVALMRRRIPATMVGWVNRIAGAGLMALGLGVTSSAILHLMH